MCAVEAFVGLALALVCGGALAQDVRAQASSAADAARQAYGTEDAFTQKLTSPLSTSAPMQSVDGSRFDAQLTCPASDVYLRTTLAPTGSSDIAELTVELDANLDGTLDTARTFPGPYSGACTNGLVQCDAGTWNNCRYFRWAALNGAPGLEEVSARDLGACYCFNASCGQNLLFVNGQKIVTDIGAGVLAASQSIFPRVMASRTQSDALSVSYYGQQSGCGVDRQPERYYSNMSALPAAGVAAGQQPGSVANLVLTSGVAAKSRVSTASCEIRRTITTSSRRLPDILTLASATAGGESSCGPGCLRVTIGAPGDNYLFGGACAVFEESAQLMIADPSRIESARLVRVAFDDHLQEQIDGTIVFSSFATWGTGAFPAGACDAKGNWTQAPNTDVLPFVQRVGRVALTSRVAVGDKGEQLAAYEFRVREGCGIDREEIVDGCTGFQSNAQCRLRNEWVDDVQTVVNGRTTGLGPLPTARQVGNACQIDSGPRNWWQTRREYDCQAEASSYDLDYATRRAQVVHASTDPTTGTFTDYRRIGANQYAMSQEALPVPPDDPVEACTPMCRTRKLRPGVNAGVPGPQSALNPTGVSYDFTIKECDASNACPLEPGEQQVAACDCRSNFAQAAAMMQTIRSVAEDTVCAPP
jgi:hypothetical protein